MHYRKSISEVVVQSCATDNWHQMLVSILKVEKNITRLSILNSFVPEDSINDTLQLAHIRGAQSWHHICKSTHQQQVSRSAGKHAEAS